jgi:outer membrane receptor protein involved in Fe transport
MSGSRIIRTPKTTFNLTISYDHLYSAGRATASISGFVSSSYRYEVLNRVRQSSYFTLNANAGWRPNDGGIAIGVFAKNLTNERYLVSALPGGTDGLLFAAPRQIGASLGFQF